MMNEHQAEGTGKGILGKAKEAVGPLTGNEDQVAEGRANQAEGNVQQGLGGVQQGVANALGRPGGQEQAARAINSSARPRRAWAPSKRAPRSCAAGIASDTRRGDSKA